MAESGSYYKDLTRLSVQEVVDNLDATIDDPYRIPSRTTFGKGNLTFTDNGNLSIAVPLNTTPTNPGTATANAGAVTNSYQIALVPETSGDQLLLLRQAYRAAVYPDEFKATARQLDTMIGSRGRWIYWKPIDAPADDPNYPIPMNATFVGRGAKYELWVTNREWFGVFTLLTYGTATVGPRVEGHPGELIGVGPVVRAAPRPEVRGPKAKSPPKTSANGTLSPRPAGDLGNLKPKVEPQFLKPNILGLSPGLYGLREKPYPGLNDFNLPR